MKRRTRLSMLATLSAAHGVEVSLFAALDQAESRHTEDPMGRLAAIAGEAGRRLSPVLVRDRSAVAPRL